MAWGKDSKKFVAKTKAKAVSKPKQKLRKSNALVFKPAKHQTKAIKFMISRGAAGLFLEPGLRKTSITLAAFKILKEKGFIDHMLLIAPVRVMYSTWPNEIKKWAEFNDITISIVHGPKKDKNSEEVCADIYVISPDGLSMITEKKAGTETVYVLKPGVSKFFSNKGRWCLVVDESSKFKNYASGRFNKIKAILDLFARRYILTGSPAPNGYMNLFSQIFILDQGNALGSYITHFRNKYFYQKPYDTFSYFLQDGAEEKIQDAIKDLVISMSAEDYLDLPDKIDIRIDIELPSKAAKIYKEIEEEFITELEGGKVITSNAGAKTQKLRQIASGGIYDEDGKTHNIHDAKTEAMMDLIDEMEGQPIIVAYEFEQDLKRILKALPKNTPFIKGGMSQTKSAKILDDFDAGRVPVLVAQMSTIAHGLNLQSNCRAMCLYSLTYDLEVYEQLIKRLHRSGQLQNVFIYHLVARGTIDDIMMYVLKAKDKTQSNFMDAIKAHLLDSV